MFPSNRIPVTSGRCGMHNRVVEHNMAAFSELSFAVAGREG